MLGEAEPQAGNPMWDFPLEAEAPTLKCPPASPCPCASGGSWNLGAPGPQTQYVAPCCTLSPNLFITYTGNIANQQHQPFQKKYAPASTSFRQNACLGIRFSNQHNQQLEAFSFFGRTSKFPQLGLVSKTCSPGFSTFSEINPSLPY